MIRVRTRALTPKPPMSEADPSEVLEDLDADTDDESNGNVECVYLDRDSPAYIWPAEEDGRYILLEESRSGTWLPYGRPISAADAEYLLEEVIESDYDTYEIRPQTALPPGRHRWD